MGMRMSSFDVALLANAGDLTISKRCPIVPINVVRLDRRQ